MQNCIKLFYGVAMPIGKCGLGFSVQKSMFQSCLLQHKIFFFSFSIKAFYFSRLQALSNLVFFFLSTVNNFEARSFDLVVVK